MTESRCVSVKEPQMSEKKKTRLRFLHCSDIHLDIPFTGLPESKSEERRRELRNSFMKMMQYVRDTNINIVLISGDLFDNEYATNTTAEVLIREFQNCKDTKFVIAPGKHDYYKDNPIYAFGRLPTNCYVFASDSVSRFDFEEYNVTVYGWAFMGSEMKKNPIAAEGKTVDDTSRVNILCAYADLNGSVDSDACPISTSDIKKFGADYCALGSRHEPSKVASTGATKYGYCGSLASIGFDEPGLGGVTLITVDYADGEVSIDNSKSVSFSHVRFETESIDITGIDSVNDIVSRISSMISSKKFDDETALRVELVGYIDPRFNATKTLSENSFGLYHCSIIDKTLPLYGTEHFRRDMSTKGEVFRHFYPLMTCDDEERRLVAARAFRVALAALESREIEF